MTPEQKAEIAKYDDAYKLAWYRMGASRRNMANEMLLDVPGGSLLDVGCGRGEMLEDAERLGFSNVLGVEATASLCGGRVMQGVAWRLPVDDRSFDVVTMFDVIEHLLHDDQLPALTELRRVARSAVIVTAADYSHVVSGVELHPGRRTYQDFDDMIRLVFAGASVTYCDGLKRWGTRSAGWRVLLP